MGKFPVLLAIFSGKVQFPPEVFVLKADLLIRELCIPALPDAVENGRLILSGLTQGTKTGINPGPVLT
jgi:hypothetical protein